MAKTTGGTRSGSSSNPSGTGGVTVEYLRSNIGSSRQRLAELENSGQGESEEARNLRTGIRLAEQMLERRGAAANVSRNISEPRDAESNLSKLDQLAERVPRISSRASIKELREALGETRRLMREVRGVEVVGSEDKEYKEEILTSLLRDINSISRRIEVERIRSRRR